MDDLAILLSQLANCIAQDRFEDLESDTVEFKPCPSSTQDWAERFKSVNAFLNTRGGVLILGIKEVQRGAGGRRYEVTGYDPTSEPKLKELARVFTDSENRFLDLTEYLPPTEILNFMGHRIAVQRVDELSADRRFAFFKSTAYKRHLTGDHVVKQPELDRHSEFLDEMSHARELAPLGTEGVEHVDLEKINEYIVQINRLQKIESLKPTIADAIPFLNRKRFLIGDKLSLLGALVCGSFPGDLLGFRAHVHGYVSASNGDSKIVQDKQDMIGNVLPLLEQANAYVLRNIQVGVGTVQGGAVSAQYPESVLREIINNAIAHRDYSINKQVVISITPGRQLDISNPGRFRDQLLLTFPKVGAQGVALLRVVPETKPRNPRLADVLRVYRKWEGRGIGMSTLVNLSLENKLNLPYFKLKSDEVTLVLQAGELVDARMQEIFESRDAYIAKRLGSFAELTGEMRAVLSYLIKSEWANQQGRYCVLLTPDNNHEQGIRALETAELIRRDERSSTLYPIYIVDRNLISDDFEAELRLRFGKTFDDLSLLWRRALVVIYRYNQFNSKRTVSAKQASFAIWATEENDQANIRGFDHFYRSVRRVFNQLESAGFIEKEAGSKSSGYVLSSGLVNTQPALF